jgi:integrase
MPSRLGSAITMRSGMCRCSNSRRTRSRAGDGSLYATIGSSATSSKGHVTMHKGGRVRYVPMTKRLTDALREARHLRGPRVLSDGTGKPLTQKVLQVLVRRTARRANVKPGIHNPAAYLLFAPGDA